MGKITQRLGLTSTAVGALLAATAAMPAAAQDNAVTSERLLNVEPENWLHNHRTYNAWRHSPLTEINKDNVSGLRLAFTVAMPAQEPSAGGGLSAMQGTPLVNNGSMYMTEGWGRVFKIDVTPGNRAYIDWIMDPAVDRATDGIINNRGVALLGDKVYSLVVDGRLVATEAATGEVAWEQKIERDPEEYFTVAPLAIKDNIVFGSAGGDNPIRGWLEARNGETGEIAWTRYTIPGPGEPGAESWGGNSWENGGGGIWVTGSYDPDQNVTVWGIGNPYPDFDPYIRPGDNLYTNSALALDADSGEIKWYFQYTPNNSWDYDEEGVHMIYEAEVNGQATKIVGHAARNGFFYQLDAVTGAFVNGGAYVNNVNWTAGLDPKTGKPVEYDPALPVQTYNAEIRQKEGQTEMVDTCPSIQGGANFRPLSYSPETSLVYVASVEGCTQFSTQGLAMGALETGSIMTQDPSTGATVTKRQLPTVPYGGVLTTAGGLVFNSMEDGQFEALDATTLETVWSINLGSAIEAPPISYAVGGKQYIAIAVGPGLYGMGFFGYPTRGEGDDRLANMQRASMLFVFTL